MHNDDLILLHISDFTVGLHFPLWNKNQNSIINLSAILCVCVCVCVCVCACALTSPLGTKLCVLAQSVLQADLLIKYDVIHISGLQCYCQALKQHGHISRSALRSHLLETILK